MDLFKTWADRLPDDVLEIAKVICGIPRIDDHILELDALAHWIEGPGVPQRGNEAFCSQRGGLFALDLKGGFRLLGKQVLDRSGEKCWIAVVHNVLSLPVDFRRSCIGYRPRGTYGGARPGAPSMLSTTLWHCENIPAANSTAGVGQSNPRCVLSQFCPTGNALIVEAYLFKNAFACSNSV